MHIDQRRVGDAGNAIILHPCGEDVAGARIDFARFVERIADALNNRARRLIAGQRGGCDLSDRDPGRNIQHAHMPEPGIDFDFDHLH